MEENTLKGDSPVQHPACIYVQFMFTESLSLGRECQLDGIFHPKLNISSSPIVNKYHEGKVQSTLKRELNAPEIVAV